MKILIVKTFPKEINTTTYNCQEVGEALAHRKAGHTCDIMCKADDGKYREEELEIQGYHIKVYYVKGFSFLKNGWFSGVDYIFEKYDILQASEYNQVYSRRLSKKYADKMVIYHGPYYHPTRKKYNLMAKVFDLLLLRRYKKLKTTFITKSELAEKYLRSKGLQNVYSVGVGIDTNLLQHTWGNEIELSKRIKKISGIKLLYVGILEDRRNPLFLLDVMAILKQKGIDVKLVVVGRYRDDSYKMTFEDAIEALGLSNDIIYEKEVNQRDLSQIYNICDIFLFPTRYDIYGMVLLEAMYFGLPTISTPCGGSQMMIENGRNGIIIVEYNTEKWSNAIIDIAKNKEKGKLLGMAATETIKSQFTWDALEQKFIDVYNKKLSE